jgi:alkanesulfonate monooxygenase SsuD/methylene tetrahydromethanopterin reductase-like flavin-dependent oxidoreductase (luciferase family)
MSLIENDWQKIVGYAKESGRDPSAIQRVQQDHFFLASSQTNFAKEFERAAAEFTNDTPTHIRDIYLAGIPEDIIPKIQTRVRGGIQHLYFNPISPDIEQLERFGKEILPKIR